MSEPHRLPPERGLLGKVRARLELSPRLVPDTLWTLLSNFIVVVSGLVVFKIISRWVPASDYGQASLVLGVVGLLNSLVAGPSVLAHMRLYFEHAKTGAGDSYINAVSRLLLVMAAGMSAVYLVIAAASLAGGERVYWTLALPAILLLFAQTQLSVTFAWLEVRKLYRTITLTQSLSRALQVPALIALLYVIASRPASVVLSQALSLAFVVFFWSVMPWWSQRQSAGPRLKISEISAAASEVFGWSLYLFNFFGWLLATSDRYIIEHFWSSKEVGIYALNYGLWSVPFLSMTAWLEQLVRARIYESAEAGDHRKMMSLMWKRLLLAGALGCAVTAIIYFFGRRIAILVIGDRYWFSATLMMVICMAHLFYALAASLHGVFHALKRTHALMWIAAVTSITNVAANLFLVPEMGIIGAAWSTLIGYLAMLILTMAAMLSILPRIKEQSAP